MRVRTGCSLTTTVGSTTPVGGKAVAATWTMIIAGTAAGSGMNVALRGMTATIGTIGLISAIRTTVRAEDVPARIEDRAVRAIDAAAIMTVGSSPHKTCAMRAHRDDFACEACRSAVSSSRSIANNPARSVTRLTVGREFHLRLAD